MAKTAMLLGQTGDGKSTSLVTNPDGRYFEDPKWKKENLTYQGLDPSTTVLFNCDGKEYPFPAERLGWKEGVNLFTSTYEKPLEAGLIENYCDKISSGSKILRVIIDTINGSMNDKEMLETRKLTFDKWYDLAKDYYKLAVKANSYRSNLIIYFFGHTVINDSGDKILVTNGKKLEKISLESKVPIVLLTHVENGINGDNTFQFETQKNKSSAKSPIGMFEEFLIPNSLKLVDDKIRNYYGIN